MKQAMVTMGSFCLTVGVMLNAYHQKKQFYPSVVYLTKSSPSMAVLYLQAFVFVILMGKTMRKIFFGQLRAAEMEHIIERSWYAITETCLAFTVFRDDFSPRFVALFTVLLFLKCFHWLIEDRVDYMERSPVISFLFHARVVLLLSLLCVLDGLFINHAYYSTVTRGASVQLVFGFEYAILLTIVVHVFSKYCLHSVDMQSENPWENKAVYLLYAELVLGFIKVVIYMLFLAIMIKVHTFPLFAIRPMYLTIRTFKKALNDVIMSRRAINNMNNLYPDATDEELAAGDNVCIICREDMVSGCKKLPCGHIFHTNCLRSWFQRQQTCPTCRMDILRNTTPNGNRQNGDQQRGQQQPFQQPAGVPNQAPAPGAVPAPPGSPTIPSGAAPSSPTGMSFPGAMPPFMMPPFMMPMPFVVPPPMPPVDFSGLSDEELNALEGTERQNVEARIQVLRNVQTLLDAAMIQMQQYTSTSASSRWSPQGFSRSSSSAVFTSPTESPVNKSDTAEVTETKASTTDKPSENGSVSLPATSTSHKDKHGLEEATGSTASASDDTTAGDVPTAQDESEMNEVRRRRLQRFESSTEGQETS